MVPGGLLKEVGLLTKGMKYRIPSLPGKGAADYPASGSSLSNYHALRVNPMVSPYPGLIQV